MRWAATGLWLLVTAAVVLAAPKRSPNFLRGRRFITGGSDAQPGELPYQLSFQDLAFGFSYHFCGAVLISEQWALTAAHCLHEEDMSDLSNFQIVGGVLNFLTDEESWQTVPLAAFTQHEDYNSDTIENDIALLQLGAPFTFNENVSAIRLPEQLQVSSGAAEVSGWGATSSGGDVPEVLQKATVPIVSDDDCRAVYGQDSIFDSMICAGSTTGQDACQGDSGGPLSCTSAEGDYLCGIVSWGFGCGENDYPGVYTEVAYYVDWINSHVGNVNKDNN